MDKFKEIREKIGKDLIWRLPKAKNKDEWSEIVFNWKFNIGLEWDIFEVGDEYRTNELSKTYGRYTVINYSKNKRGRIYKSVHSYVGYTIEYFRKYKMVPDDFDFIYVWDSKDKKLIVVWENDREKNQFEMGKEFADKWFSITGQDSRSFSNLKIY